MTRHAFGNREEAEAFAASVGGTVERAGVAFVVDDSVVDDSIEATNPPDGAVTTDPEPIPFDSITPEHLT